MSTPQGEPTMPRPGRCELCNDLEVVRYHHAALARPAPFCGRCGRHVDLVLVDSPPWHPPRRTTAAQAVEKAT